MKTFLECLSEAVGNQPLPITEYIKLINNEKLTRLLNKAADIYAELSNSHKQVVSGKRPTQIFLEELISKAVDETYKTVDPYVTEYVDSKSHDLLNDIIDLKSELFQAACASGVVDTVAEGKAVTHGICRERNCNEPATKDYNGHEHWVCDYHYDKLNDEFDEEYR